MTNSWAYETPLEAVPDGVTLDPRVIEINGMKWQARSDCVYPHDYYKIMEKVSICNAYSAEMRKKFPARNELNLYRNTILDDLWFIVYFVCKNPLANHPFVVQACREVQEEKDDSLEEWARDHLKTTIISVAKQIQKVLNDPERRIAILSAVRPLAVKIQNLIKAILEQAFLVKCFPDILYEDPSKEAPKWTEAPEGGLIVKRQGFHKEPTFASYGLVEGLPAGPHHTDLIYDDIMTQEYENSPEAMAKIFKNFEMSWNLGSRGCQKTVVGTPYRHDDVLHMIRELKNPDTDQPLFKNRKKPATEGGKYRGKAVFSPEIELTKKRAGTIYIFYCQQLVNPTPQGEEKLNKAHLILIPKTKLPERLYKFMMIDGSGSKGKRVDRPADAWAFIVAGVEPYRDEIGISRVFILDMIIDKMAQDKAIRTAADMYCRNGRILKLGVEKVAMSTTEIHICAALRARKRFLSIEAGNLEILNPAGRDKKDRIESALAWPLKNGKIHIVDTIPAAYRSRFEMEMDKFPAWEDDGLDGFSYLYDMIKDFRFPAFQADTGPDNKYDQAFARARENKGSAQGWQRV